MRSHVLNFVKPAFMEFRSLNFLNGAYTTMVDCKKLRTPVEISERKFQDACSKLHSLRSAMAVREKATKHAYHEVTETKKQFLCLGMTMEKLDQLSVVHIAGTKGKGSTCAYTESILRNCGYKTGMFCSPHLVDLRERIQINGRHLSESTFSRYFFEVYDRLLESMKNGAISDMPHYFQFLTLMALYVFLKEPVDVAILEVGIGGQYDCTNFINTAVVCGISLLDYDHEHILGSTLDEIAWQKAGIFKHRVPAITQPQHQKAMNVLIERAQAKNNPLYTVSGNVPGLNKDATNYEPFQLLNISLAIQLARVWLRDHDQENSRKQWFSDCNIQLGSTNLPVLDCDFPDFSKFTRGIKTCHIPGRLQIIKHESVSFYLDGAHTEESMKACADWFLKQCNLEMKSKSSTKMIRVLMFTVTGGRKVKNLLSILKECSFDVVIFLPNLQHNPKVIEDLKELATLENMEHCRDMQTVWYNLHQEISECQYKSTRRNTMEAVSILCPSVNDALYWCSSDVKNLVKPSYKLIGVPALLRGAAHIQLLATGSLLLVGKLLSFLNTDGL
ncbi:folylpolyglutamate synthase, mitochondrial-like isoform X1 [Octopus vulgaris]|uniref:Folylpolyglutamate synthase n=1 Tax=Octopus vulgaris TaxID=6645 RepID=A0AA36EWI4_OCTVU|nr:folylpolyglutamate synthase, mitochondrial-like isoform X1 [Octopus vulgaris]